MLRPLGIRTRLTVWYSAILATTLVTLGLIVFFSASAMLRGSVDEALAVQASDVHAAVDRGEELRLLESARPGIFTAIFGSDGRIRSRSPGVPRGLVMPPVGSSTIPLPSGDAWAAVLAQPASDGTTIVVGTSLADVDRNLDNLAMLLAITGAAGFFASIAGGWLLSGRALGPVARLTQEADAIGPGDLERRLPQPHRLDEVGRLARTLNGMLDRVAGSIRRERRFIAAASHDLRTPIATLRTELELAQRTPDDPAEMLAAIRIAHADAIRLSNLASDLLDLAEAEATGRALLRQPVPVVELAEGAMTRVRPLADERETSLRLQAPDVRVAVDRVRLEQALVNLLANAIREAPAGSVVEVVASVNETPSHDPSWTHQLEMAVSDRGPGVSPAVRPGLFLPFASPAHGRIEGTGLGLATADAAVRAHDGEIRYEDRDGGGATFRFRVPTRRVDDDRVDVPALDAPRIPAYGRAGGARPGSSSGTWGSPVRVD